MKKVLVLMVLFALFVASDAQTQIHEHAHKKSFIEERIEDVKHRIEIVEKHLKESWQKIDRMREKGLEIGELAVITETLERGKMAMKEELEHLINEMSWRKRLPEEIRKKIEDLERLIQRQWEERKEKDARKHERELHELLDRLHREFEQKLEREHKLELTEDMIWRHMPEEVKEKIRKHNEAIEKLLQAGYEDMANELREKVKQIFEETKRDLLEKMHREHREPKYVEGWWKKLPKEMLREIEELKNALYKAASMDNKDLVNRYSDRLHELYVKAISNHEHKESDPEKVLKELQAKKEAIRVKLHALEKVYELTKSEGKEAKASEILAAMKELKEQIEKIERHIVELKNKQESHKKEESHSK